MQVAALRLVGQTVERLQDAVDTRWLLDSLGANTATGLLPQCRRISSARLIWLLVRLRLTVSARASDLGLYRRTQHQCRVSQNSTIS